MTINEHTKIAALLKHHPDALEKIVSIAPDFKKLRNPILRKLMAGRTSIAMASKIGKCTPEDFYKVLQPLGFTIEYKSSTSVKTSNNLKKELPNFIVEIPQEHIVILDVREMLASGTDPLKRIQNKVKEMKQGEVLKIVNTFEPTPLIKLLEKQGFTAYVEEINNDIINTYFYKNTQKKDTKVSPANQPQNNVDWEQIMLQYQNKIQEIDVRNLEMPMPMLTILEALETLPKNKALLVHHKRVPVFLLDELKEKNYAYLIKSISENEVKLILYKQT